MSQENVKEFFNKIEEQEDLGEEYKSLLISCKELSEDDALEKVIGFARDKGCVFSAENIKSFSKDKESDELNEEELDAVSGGLPISWVVGGSSNGDETHLCVVIGVPAPGSS